jgi:hypothetical protein
MNDAYWHSFKTLPWRKPKRFFGYLGSLKLFNIKRNIPIVRCDASRVILGLFAAQNPAKCAMVYAA